MEIPQSLLDKWTSLRSPGDSGKMSEKLKGSDKETFSRAFRLGRCRDEVFEVMKDYYQKKERKLLGQRYAH